MLKIFVLFLKRFDELPNVLFACLSLLVAGKECLLNNVRDLPRVHLNLCTQISEVLRFPEVLSCINSTERLFVYHGVSVFLLLKSFLSFLVSSHPSKKETTFSSNNQTGNSVL